MKTPAHAHAHRKRARPRARTLANARTRTAAVGEWSTRVGQGPATFHAAPREPGAPQTRAECGDQRPCPWVGCRYNLYLDVNPETGSIKLNFPELEPWDMRESCALDVAARDEPPTLDAIGAMMNLSRERIRQLEVAVLVRVRMLAGGDL